MFVMCIKQLVRGFLDSNRTLSIATKMRKYREKKYMIKHWTQKLCQTFKETLGERVNGTIFIIDIESYDESINRIKSIRRRPFVLEKQLPLKIYIQTQHTHTHTKQQKRWLSIYRNFASPLQLPFPLAFCSAVAL